MDAFKSENGSEIGTSSVTDDVLIRRRFEAKEPDKTLVFWSIFWDVFDARTRRERAPGVYRRRGRLESPRDEAQGPARASALLRDFLRSVTRRKIRISISSKKVPSLREGVTHLRGRCARREEATFVWVEPERFIDSVRVSVVPRKAVVAPR